MNRFTRLTALLLALMMILSTFAAAETAYQVGDMTTEQWNSIVQNAQSILNEPVIDEGDSGKVITPPMEPPVPSAPYDKTIEVPLGQNKDITTVNLAVVKSDVAAQWQIAIKEELWVNILGETGNTLNVNAGMLQGTAMKVRQAGNDAQVTAFTLSEATAAVQTFAVENRADSTTTTPSAANDVSSLQDANPNIEQWTVEIRYVFADSQNTAANSWTGKVAKNAALYTSAIVLPRVVGYYASTVTTANVDADSYKFVGQKNSNNNFEDGTIQLEINSVTADLVLYVNYSPAPMDFKVTHVYQDVNGEFPEIPKDGSTVDGITVETKSGMVTGTAVGAVAKSEEGFTNLWYDETVKIAADGSTNIIVYYERDWYLMLFDCNGGYGTEPVYARYGAPLTHKVSTRAGYSFEGWKLIESNGNVVTDAATIAHSALPSTMPHENHTYQAQWAEGDTTYTVVYWFADLKDGTNPTTYSDVGRKTVTATSGTILTPSDVGTDNPATEVVDPATGEKAIVDAPYFTYDAVATATQNNNDATVTVVGDGSTVVNVYYSRNEYTIQFIYARKNGSNITVSKSTGCGTYNNDNHDWQANHGHADTDWSSYNVQSIPSVKAPYNQNTADFSENGVTYYYFPLTAEYGADIASSWPAAPLESASGYNVTYEFGSWAAQCGSPYREEYGAEHSNIVGVYPTMSDEMIMDPDNSIAQKMVAWWAADSDGVYNHTYHNYFEVLPEELDYDVELANGKRYKLVESVTFTCAHNGNTRVDPVVYTGLTCVNDNKTAQGNSSNFAWNQNCPHYYTENWCVYCNVFYYDRDTYTLSFVNYNAESPAPASKNLMFGQSIISAKPDKNPEYPTGLEASGYKFVGWYTTPECQDGTEVDWNSTMPAGDMTVYAKWVSDDHTIIFYTDEADCTAENPVVYEGPYTLLHNEVFSDTYQGTADLAAIENPTNYKNTNLSFIGWFYKDTDGTEKAWTPKMAVKKDLELYGKWGLTEPVAFTVYFKLKDGTDVADPIVGKTLVDADSGTQNIDLEAKTGYDLFAKYQVGIFPITTSHTLVVDVNNTDNTYKFEYVEKEAVPYLVRYLIEDANGSIEIAGKKYRALVDSKVVADNRNAIVTEPYQMVPGYMPDEYQKRLIVTGEESNNWITEGNVQIHPDNVINFIYHVDTENAFYAVEHYIQPVDGSDDRTTWTQVGVADSATGKIGLDVTATPRTIPGFTYHDVISESYYKDAGTATVTGNALTTKLTDGGVLFKLYYNRNQYPYVVRYLEVDTNAPVHDPWEANAYYQAVVTETAEKLIVYNDEQYELVTSESQQITIQKEETPTLNVITFFYEKRVPITYVAMTKDANGTIAKNNIGGNVDLNDGESNLQPENSEPVRIKTGTALGATAVKNANYKFVGWYNNEACSGTALSTNESYIPEKFDGKNVRATYYALFELDVAPLTIRKTVTGVNKPTGDIFEIQIELKDASDNALSGSYPYGPATDKTGPNGTLTLTNGVGTIGKIEDGDEIVIENVVIGTKFTVTEISKPRYYEETITGGTGSITNAAGALVEIRNAYQAGNLVITKIVDPATGAPDDTFTMNVTLTLPGSSGATLTPPTSYTVGDNTYDLGDGVVELKNGQSATIAGLPYGTKYTVTENDMTYYTGTINPSGEQTIEHASQEVEVTNTYNTGTLEITKTVVGNAPADEFAIKVALTLPNGLTALPGSVQREVSAGITPGNVSVANGVATQTFTGVKKDGKITLSGLPVGTQYAVEESGKPAYYETTGEVAASENKAIVADTISTVSIINSYKSGNLQITKAVTPTSAGATLPTEDKFTIVVTLTKPEGSKVDWNSTPVVCTIQNGAEGARYTVKDDTITFTGIVKDSVINITGLPAGTTYTITEAETYPSYYTKAGEITTPVAIVAGQTAEATLTNTYHTSNLVVEKEVRSENAGTTAPDDEFELKVTFGLPTDHGATAQLPTSYTKNGSTVDFKAVNGVVTISNVKAGDMFTFNNLPAGTTYKVEESTPPSYYTQSGEVTTATPIAAGSTETVKITNTYYAGSLMVKKNVTSNPTVTPLPDERFAIDVKIELPANSGTALTLASIQSCITMSTNVAVELKDGVFHFTNVANASEIKFDNLPYGTEYTVTEITPPGYYEVAIDHGNATIGEQNQNPEVTITNTYKTGTLKVTKVVGGNAPADEFAITVTLTLPNGLTTLPDSVKYKRGENETKPDSTTIVLDKVTNGDTITIYGLPVGTQYNVTEVTPPSYYTSDIFFADETKTITNASEVDEVTVTNTYNKGRLTVTKSVTSNPNVATLPQDTFTIDVELELPKDNEAKVSLDHIAINKPDSVVLTLTSGGFQFTNVVDGAQIVLDNLPHGTKYTVTEINVPGYYEVTYTGSNTNIIDAKTQDSATKDTTVAITNTYLTGSLTVTKKVDKPFDSDLTAEYPSQFQFTLALTDAAGNPVNATVTATDARMVQNGNTCTFSLQNNGSITLSGIPHGVKYTVTEDSTSIANYYTTTVSVNGAEATSGYVGSGTLDATANTVDAPATVAFVNTAKTSKLTVVKTGMSDGESAIVNVKVGDETYMVALNGSSSAAVITNLPIGADYSATETDWSWRYTKNGIDYSDPEQKINKEGTSTITVKNSSTGDKWLHDEDSKTNIFGTN